MYYIANEERHPLYRILGIPKRHVCLVRSISPSLIVPSTDFDRLLQKTEDDKYFRYTVEKVGSGHTIF